MATKKEKRARGLAKREAFLANERELGRKAIEADHKRRAIEARKRWETAHEKHYKFDDDCPLCAEIKAKQAIEKLASAAGKPARKNVINDLLADSPVLKDESTVEEAIDLTRTEKVGV